MDIDTYCFKQNVAENLFTMSVLEVWTYQIITNYYHLK